MDDKQGAGENHPENQANPDSSLLCTASPMRRVASPAFALYQPRDRSIHSLGLRSDQPRSTRVVARRDLRASGILPDPHANGFDRILGTGEE